MVRTPVMMLGCASDAGKSFLVMALCRALANRGLRVAPFKAQNMSNNAAVTPSGLEIGRAQYAQALASRVVPDVRMNPILLKPLSDTRGAVIVSGRPAPDVEALPWTERPRLTWPVVESSLRSLMDDFDLVVIEGAGSPAEVNLRSSDIVNMRVAMTVSAHSYLCSDIDRGGSFAHLLGTWHCLEPDEQRLLRGFVLNRFRGDPHLLGDATSWLQDRTGVPTVAVVPWIHHQLPEEDRLVVRNADQVASTGQMTRSVETGSLAQTGRSVRIGIVLYPYASNTDEFDSLGSVAGVDVTTIRERRPLDHFDAIILPGSRNVAASVRWLRETGLALSLAQRVDEGIHVLGICGGMQLLGHQVLDPHKLEGGDTNGLGLLDVTTQLALDKTTRPFRGRLLPTGNDVAGYEIHHGVTEALAESISVPLFVGDAGWQQGNIVGVYVHALLEDTGFREWWLRTVGFNSQSESTSRSMSWADTLDAEFDRVAAIVESTGLVEHVLQTAAR